MQCRRFVYLCCDGPAAIYCDNLLNGQNCAVYACACAYACLCVYMRVRVRVCMPLQLRPFGFWAFRVQRVCPLEAFPFWKAPHLLCTTLLRRFLRGSTIAFLRDA